MAGELDGLRVVWLRARHGGVAGSARASSEGRSQQHSLRIARANPCSPVAVSTALCSSSPVRLSRQAHCGKRPIPAQWYVR